MPLVFAAIAPHGFPHHPRSQRRRRGRAGHPRRDGGDGAARRGGRGRGAGDCRAAWGARRRRRLPGRYGARGGDAGMAGARGRAECPARRAADRRHRGDGAGAGHPDRHGRLRGQPARSERAADGLGHAHPAVVSGARTEHAGARRCPRRSAGGGHRPAGGHRHAVAQLAAGDAGRVWAGGRRGGRGRSAPHRLHRLVRLGAHARRERSVRVPSRKRPRSMPRSSPPWRRTT